MATDDVAKTGAPISKNIYGQFLEHGGDIVNAGIWSEMPVDRKFFYPVATVAPTPPPAIGNAAGNPRFENIPKRWWAPVGGDSAVTMDSKAPYTGDQTSTVRLSTAEPHGLRQSGLVVRNKKTYTGRVVLAGTSGTVVRGALIGNSGAAGRQSITIHALNAFTIYHGTHTGALADRFQNFVMSFFSKNLCFAAPCH